MEYVHCLDLWRWFGLVTACCLRGIILDYRAHGHCGVITFQPVEDVELVDRPATAT